MKMNRIIGIILVIIGGLIVLDNFHIDFFEHFWPVLIIAAGIFMIFHSKKKKSKGCCSHFEVFSDSSHTAMTGDIDGSGRSYFIHDSDLDLTGIQLRPGNNNFSVSSFIGDIRLTLPNDMAVRVHASNFIGDLVIFNKNYGGFITTCDDKTDDYDSSEKKLYINCSSFIGDIKIFKVGQ